MVGGTSFHRRVIQREISGALVLNLSGEKRGADALHGTTLPLTEPSLLSWGCQCVLISAGSRLSEISSRRDRHAAVQKLKTIS